MTKKITWNWKSILSIIVVIALLMGTLALVIGLTSGNNRTKIKSGAFVRGSLNSSGKYVESDQAIYTKEAFGAIGLRVEPDFEFVGTYDVFYYDYNDNLVDSKLGLDYIYDEDHPLAMMARIVIHPAIPSGENSAEFKIKWHQVNKYANQFNITVNNNQSWKYESDNLYNKDTVTLNKGFNFSGGDTIVNIISSTVHKVTEYLPTAYHNYDIYVRPNCDDINWTGAVVIASETDMRVIAVDHVNMANHRSDEWVKLSVSIEGELSSDYRLIVKMPLAADCYIFGYN